jgi:hypothetical protein
MLEWQNPANMIFVGFLRAGNSYIFALEPPASGPSVILQRKKKLLHFEYIKKQYINEQ